MPPFRAAGNKKARALLPPFGTSGEKKVFFFFFLWLQKPNEGLHASADETAPAESERARLASPPTLCSFKRLRAPPSDFSRFSTCFFPFIPEKSTLRLRAELERFGSRVACLLPSAAATMEDAVR
jgi:hypothetical protein